MSLELLVLTVDEVLVRTDELHRAAINVALRECYDDAGWTSEAHAMWKRAGDSRQMLRAWLHARHGRVPPAQDDALYRAYQKAFVERCARQAIGIRWQALRLMDSAEQGGARLALVAPMSSRMLCALLDGALGADWVDRFSVVATADALSAQETEADLYRLVLRTADVPAHRALLAAATEYGLRAAQGIGMHAVNVLPEGSEAVRLAAGLATLSSAPQAIWPEFHALESLVPTQPPRATDASDGSRATAEPLAN